MFDQTYNFIYEGNKVEYGCVLGSNTIVYIKAGRGGSYHGYEDKYLKIAHRLHDQYGGCSVICVSNPVPLPVSVDQTILDTFVQEHGFDHPELFFFGNSNGCVKGLEIAANGVEFKRMVLVNMPLMLNFHKTVHWMKLIPTTEIVTVYGEKDPSYSYVPFLECQKLSNVEIVKIQGADHNFRGMMGEFLKLSDMLLKSQKKG